MGWTIKFAGVLFTVALTGSILFCVWYLLSIFLKKRGYGRLCRIGVWAVSLFYLIPALYPIMLQSREIGRWGGTVFEPTITIVGAAAGIILVWGIGAGIMCFRLCFRLIAQYKNRKAQIPCEQEIQMVFDGICQEIGIQRGEVEVVWDYVMEVPCFMGILRPRVALPVQNFSKEQLKMIMLHELTHYKQRDMYLLALVQLIQMIHWFCPPVWFLGKAARQYSEYACDEKVCGRVGGRKIYYDMIFEVMCASNYQKGLFSMYMIEDKNELVRRKKYMKVVETRKKKPIVCVVCCFLMVVCSSMTIWAAADEMGNRYQKWYQGTVVEVEDYNEQKVYEEFTDYGPDADIQVETYETDLVTRSMTNIMWTVGSNVMKTSSGFSVKKGQTVTINISVEPNTKSIKAGIIDSVGKRTYVMDKGSINHSFKIQSAGTYRVFVENANTVSVTVGGCYTVQ